jgi:uncharacterized iron-regulated protein
MAYFQAFFIAMFFYCTPNQTFAQLYDGRSLQTSTVDQIAARVSPGSILILGENHGLTAHRDQHMLVLNELRKQGFKVSVGLEFVNYTDQTFVEQYKSGEIKEDQFLSLIKWTGMSFDYYKQQLNFPLKDQGEFSLGLNLPRTISSKISKTGLGSLTADEMKLLPPNFELGRDSYKERFREAAGAHCPHFENCFTAQSAWDDTMAWTATQFIEAHPDQVLVIVVGEFHAQYGGGLANRIEARRPHTPVTIVSQIWAEDMTADEIQQALQPSAFEGPRGDYIWVSQP